MHPRLPVLLIEDNPGDARLITEIARDGLACGQQIEWVDRLAAGLAALEERQFAAVLLDLSLPDSHGLETVRAVLPHATDTPIVVLTGLDDEAVAFEAVRAGAQDYLVKGKVDGHLLARALRYAMERKRLVEELRASEERFRHLAENARDIIFRYRLVPERRMDYISPAVEAITGYRPAEYYSDPLLPFKIMSPDERLLLDAATLTPDQFDGQPVLHRWLRKDGTLAWLESKVMPVLDANGGLVAVEGVVRDVTERQQAEEALRKYAHIFEYALWGMVIGSADGTTLEMMNPHFARMHGYTVEELRGRPITDVFAPECRGKVAEQVRIAHQQGHHSWESRHIRKDGSVFPVLIDVTAVKDERGNVLYRIVNVQDITERRQVEEEHERLHRQLEAERNWLDAVIARSPVGILLVEGPDGQRLRANRRAEELLGRPIVPEQGIFQYIGQICHPDGAPITREELVSFRALRGELVRRMEEKLLRRPDGVEIPVSVSGGPIRDGAGNIVGAVVIFEDITQLKELERLREEWVSIIAHDLRQPITAITGYAGLLARQVGERPALQAQADHILASARQLSRMIADLLDASRLEAQRLRLEPQPVDLAALVSDVVERTAAALAGHPVRVDTRGDLPALEADPGRIEQALTNLLTNAAKYGYPDTEILIELAHADGTVKVSVTNQGDGIPPDELPHLFTRFRRTRAAQKGKTKGIGLGLYITKGLIEAHGGRIWAESTPGHTTTFRFVLPVAGAGSGVIEAA